MLKLFRRGLFVAVLAVVWLIGKDMLPMITPTINGVVSAGEQVLSTVTMATNARASLSVPATGEIDVGFSPGGTAELVVVSAIRASRQNIRVAAYSFTSKVIAKELVEAHKRGIDVQVVLDKSQLSERYTSATFLANAGIPVRIDSEHAIQHNKYIVVDGRHLQTGSFNYTSSAASRNAENVILMWNSPSLAGVYLRNWNEHWAHARSTTPP